MTTIDSNDAVTVPDRLRRPTDWRQTLSPFENEAISNCMGTLRSIRHFRQLDVDQRHVDFILQHAVQAGSAKNRQPWRFVVVREQMSALATWYRRGWQLMTECVLRHPDQFTLSKEHQRQMRDGMGLVETFHSAPVAIVTCFLPTTRNSADFYGGASIYPAVQNLLLAARALGLGATLTTIMSIDGLYTAAADHRGLTDELRSLLAIPDEAVPAAVIPLGWPTVEFAPVRRKPVSAVAFSERWGLPWPSPDEWVLDTTSGGDRDE